MAKEYIEREAALNAIKNEIDSIKSNYSTTPYEFVRRGLQIDGIFNHKKTTHRRCAGGCKV